jgi:hypothetical protein
MQASKEYRHGFIEEAIRSRLVAQMTALRKAQNWDLKTFAEKLAKKLSWAYRLEDPNSPPPTIPSLLEVAAVHDVGLDVRFCAFSEMLEDATNLSPESFSVPSFDAEIKAGAFLDLPPQKRWSTKTKKRKHKLTVIHGRLRKPHGMERGIVANEIASARSRYGT